MVGCDEVPIKANTWGTKGLLLLANDDYEDGGVLVCLGYYNTIIKRLGTF